MAASLCAAGVIEPVPAWSEIRGAAVTARGSIVTWGDRVEEWRGGKPKIFLSEGGFGEGGCVAGNDLILQSGPALVRLKAPRWTRETIEAATDFSDCLWTNLFGHQGVLINHLRTQLRFYQPGRPWVYQELYSIYTASTQGGLVRMDVDLDGRDDFYVGNYWMKSPDSSDLPWRLFAINLYHETSTAALARLAPYRATDLVWAERTGSRVTWFERPADVREQWIPHPLDLQVKEPNGLVTDGDRIVVGDATHVLLWEPGRTRELASGFRTLQMFLIRGRLWAVTPADVREIVYPRK